MAKEYQGFSISNFRTGFDKAVEPWLLPRDAFQVLKNCHLYRGVVDKIQGYTFYARMSYREIIEMTGTIDGVNDTFTAVLSPLPTTGQTTIQAAINATATARESFVDNGSGVLTGSNGGSGTINYSTGAVSVTFGAAPPADLTVGGIQYNAVILSYDHVPAQYEPIMGIKPYYQDVGSLDTIVFDTRRAGRLVVLVNDIATAQQSDYGITELPHETQSSNITTGFNGTTGPYTGVVTNPLVPGEVKFIIYNGSSSTSTVISTITDNGNGALVGAQLDPAQPNFINYFTGEWVMNFLVGQEPQNTYFTDFFSCIYGDVFTGDFKNFFSTVNYQNKLFFTNAIDGPFYYDGMCVKYLNTTLNPANTKTVYPYQLTKVLHVTVNRERLLLMAPYVGNVPRLNSIYWSVVADPLNFTNNAVLEAPTSQSIQAFSFINSDLVVRFSASERIFRYTGDEFGPFRWDLTNVIWQCDAPYSAINYDSWFSSVGKTAIVGSDGVNVKRADEIIPDFTLNLRIDEQQPVLSIDQTSIGQCYGERFDDFKEGWLCYRNYDEDSTGGIQPSNSVLAFNYLDGTYAIYTFPFSCLGTGRIIATDVWGNNFDLWGEANYTWGSYSQSANALTNLAGDQNGIIYELGNGNSITEPDGTFIPCLFEAITKDFNPFVEEGQLARFGYVDFLVSSNNNTKFRVQFYVDNELDADFTTYYQESILDLTSPLPSVPPLPPVNKLNTKIWKRIYVGSVGKSHTMRIYQNADDFIESGNQPLRIHAIVPYFKPAGRIFN